MVYLCIRLTFSTCAQNCWKLCPYIRKGSICAHVQKKPHVCANVLPVSYRTQILAETGITSAGPCRKRGTWKGTNAVVK